MPYEIITEIAASISELKADPMKVVSSGEGAPITIINRNEPAFYCVPVETFESIMDLVEDKELIAIAETRMGGETVSVTLDDL